jgi:hypothetical protein
VAQAAINGMQPGGRRLKFVSQIRQPRTKKPEFEISLKLREYFLTRDSRLQA